MIKHLLSFLLRRAFFLTAVLAFLSGNQSFAQCSPNTSTTFSIDLSGSSDTTVSIQSTRNGNSCSGSNCITFNILVNPASNFVNFSVANPAPPGGAFYQINCGPQTSLGVPACISGMTTVCISYCKPGNDNATYTLTTSSGIKGSADLTLGTGCTGVMSITGLVTSSINWTSIFPGATGAYNSYLSCISGCASTNVTPLAGAPAYIDYKVTGTKICGGTLSDTVRVYNMPPLAVTITPVNPVICGTQNITLTATPTGGGGTYNYSWNNGQTTQSIVVNSSGTYTVTVSDNTICANISQSITVAAAPLPAAPTAINNGPLCVGSTLNLTANTIAGATYSWTGPNGFTSNIQNPVIASTTLANAGTYNVTATVNGCTSATGSTAVVINPIPSAPTAGNNGPLCVGSTLNLTANTIAGATYNWTGPNSFISNIQNPAIASTTLANAGTYNVTATVNGCTSAAGSTTVVINSIPSAPTASNNGPLCVGSTLNLSANTIAGATYNWTGPNGFTSNIQNPVIANTTLANAGTYNVTATVNGCTSVAGSTTVVINPIPSAPTAGNNGPLCVGSTLNLSANAIAGATYNWTGPNSFTSNAQNPVINNTTLLHAGTYNVTATVNGCTSAAGSTAVVINPIPSAPTAGNNGPLCVGAALNLTANTIAGATYSWTGSNGFTSAQQNPIITNITLADAGTYNVTVTVNGCTSAPGSATVVINAIPSQPIAGNNGPLCVGSALNLSANTIAGATYNWTGPNGFTSNIQNPVIANTTLANAGTYNVTATVNGCISAAGSTTVVINPIPSAPTAGNNGPLCVGSTLNLTATTIAGATYNWTGPNSFTSNIQNPVIASTTLANAGTYNVTATVNGCTSAAGSTAVVINPIPSAPAAGNNGPLCIGSTLNLTANTIAGATYSWTGSNGFTSAQQNPIITNITLADAGTYNVTVTVNGCTSPSAFTTVVINAIPSQPIAGNNGPLCVGAALNLTAGTITGATYNWTGPNNFTSNLQNPIIASTTLMDAGTYNVTASVNGCTGVAGSTTVIVNPIPAAPTVTNNGPLCIGITLSLTTNTIAGATYNWTGPNGFTSNIQNPQVYYVTLSDAGTYDVTATVNGCTSVAGHTAVIIHPTPAIPIATSNGPVCAGSTLNLTASTITGASYLWTGPNGFSSSLQNPVIANITSINAGVYLVMAVVNGCKSAISTTQVVINPVPAAPAATNNGPVCVGSPVNLTANTIAGATYYWTGPNGFTSNLQNPVIANTAIADAGTFRTYNVTVTVNGCTSASSSTTVVVYPMTTIPAATNNGALCAGNTLNLKAGTVTGATYNWTGPNGFTSNLQNPVIANISLANAGTYNVTATLNGCTSAAGSTTVVINPIPSAPMAGNNGPLCVGSALNLSAANITGANYNWTGPNGFTSDIQDPVVNNISLANGGTYTVTATVNGCTSPAGSTIVVVNPIPATPTAGSNGPLCAGSTLNLTANTITGATYNWTGPNNFISILQNPIIANSTLVNAGVYNVTATVNGCTSAAGSATVVINSPAISNAGIDQTICASNNNVNLTGTVAGGSITGIWTSSGTGTFSPGNTSLNTSYILTAADKSKGSVTLTLTSINNGACPVSTSSVLITLTPDVIMNAGSDMQICADVKSVSLSGQTTASGAVWTTNGTGTFSPDNKTLNATYALSAADKLKNSLTFTLTSTGIVNCNTNSDDVKLIINSLPSVNAGPDRSVLENQTMILNPVTNGANLKYLWTPNLYLNSDIIKNPTVTGINDQLYTVTVTDAAGCSNEDQVFVKVLRSFIIPNTFTPNNDGINDTWIIKHLSDYKECRVQVFNRYGQLVFESKGYSKPWDGTYYGKSSPFGTYYYVIEPGNGVKPFTGYVTIIK